MSRFLPAVVIPSLILWSALAVRLPCGSSIQHKVGRGLHIPMFDYPQRQAFSNPSHETGVCTAPAA
jgi:hypothetical protein